VTHDQPPNLFETSDQLFLPAMARPGIWASEKCARREDFEAERTGAYGRVTLRSNRVLDRATAG
jgi:hypothetical protein